MCVDVTNDNELADIVQILEAAESGVMAARRKLDAGENNTVVLRYLFTARQRADEALKAIKAITDVKRDTGGK